jgi:nucleotide-binding universal stress UspA family protein
MKTICVHIDEGERFNERARVAAGLAARLGATLKGVFTQRTLVLPAEVAGDLARTVIGQHERAEKELAEAAQTVLAEAAAGQGLAAPGFERTLGEPVAALTPHCLLADLLVVAQTDGDNRSVRVPPDFADQMADAAGLPVLVVPYAGHFPEVGRRVLIAWKPSPQAARAVRAAIPLLEKAERVDIVGFVGKRASGDETGPTPGVAQVAAMLASHGVQAKAVELPLGGVAVGEMLLSYAADRQSDLLVMGCYSHSRLRERVLGGVTRTMLGSMTIPVLLAR